MSNNFAALPQLSHFSIGSIRIPGGFICGLSRLIVSERKILGAFTGMGMAAGDIKFQVSDSDGLPYFMLL